MPETDPPTKPLPVIAPLHPGRSLAIGLAVAAFVAGLSELLALAGIQNPAPGPYLMGGVVIAAFFGGTVSGVTSALLLGAYGFRVFGHLPDGVTRNSVAASFSLVAGFVVGFLRQRLAATSARAAQVISEQEKSRLNQAAAQAIEAKDAAWQNRLEARENLFRASIEASLDAFDLMQAIRGPDGKITDFRITLVNARTEKLTGVPREKLEGAVCCEIFPVTRESGFLQKYIQVVETGEPWQSEFPISADNVRAAWLNQQVVKVGDGVAIFSRDITARKRLEEEASTAQKMDNIGRLAGGVAHDFNNLLTVIIGYANLAEPEAAKGDPMLQKAIANILSAADRAADLTRQLLAFARRQVIEPRTFSLNETVTEVEKLLARLIGEDIQLVTSCQPDLWPCKADPGQLAQVLMNLAVNARDAMPKGGKLTIETGNVTLGESYAAQHAEVGPGQYVMVAVSDTGQGMDEETKLHVFEPFFTTKESGKGTGLGLATTYGIVKQSGGHIWFYSEKGHGTTFKVYLPRATSDDAPAVAPELPTPVRGRELILLVEDEQMLRDFAALTLRAQGYQVVHASNGDDALVRAREIGPGLDLLVTDVVMPGMSGKELAQKLRAEMPKLKVLYTSGYTANVIVHHGVLESGVKFLSKPFTPMELAAKVREVLGTSAG